MIKNAIFLVEEIIDGHPISLYEKVSWKLYQELKNGPRPLLWLTEVPRLLSSSQSPCIEFMTVKDFMQDVSNGGWPEDRNVFYYIACRYTLQLTNPTDFLLIDSDVLKFLAEKKIPIILDSSCEQINHYEVGYDLFQHPKHDWIYDRPELEILKQIPFIIVGSTDIPYGKNTVSKVDAKFTFFPSGFFFYNYKGSKYNQSLLDHQQDVLDRIKQKQINDQTFIWEMWHNEPRWYRTLFQLKAEHEKLTGPIGRYSRLNKCRQRLVNFMTNNNQPHGVCAEAVGHPYFSFLDSTLLDSADEVKILNTTAPWPRETDCNFVLEDVDTMFYVAAETCEPRFYNDIINSTSNLTEKSTIRITSGQAFIPLGGQNLGSILKDLGFKDFRKLEWHNESNVFDEIDYILDRIRDISSLSLSAKQNLYEEWKENLTHNFNHYINVDIAKEYLRHLYNAN
jgi:hypothetical protein